MALNLKPLDDDQHLKDNYNVLSVIGIGGVATVYAVEEISTDRILAMKVTAKENQFLGKSYNDTRMLQENQEVPIIASFVREYESWNNIYLFESSANQGDLHHWMQRRFRTREQPFSEREVIGILAELIVFLDALHDKNILFCGLKFENITCRSTSLS